MTSEDMISLFCSHVNYFLDVEYELRVPSAAGAIGRTIRQSNFFREVICIFNKDPNEDATAIVAVESPA
jgi:hypothetical protein